MNYRSESLFEICIFRQSVYQGGKYLRLQKTKLEKYKRQKKVYTFCARNSYTRTFFGVFSANQARISETSSLKSLKLCKIAIL